MNFKANGKLTDCCHYIIAEQLSRYKYVIFFQHITQQPNSIALASWYEEYNTPTLTHMTIKQEADVDHSSMSSYSTETK